MYRATTRQVQVTVSPRFAPERSDADMQQYFWTYTIEVANIGAERVQLINRHWIITDALGQVQEVRGPGVVGEQPVLGPGERFEYTSGCPLTTPGGFMEGSYEMEAADGTRFDAEIPAFSLDIPGAARILN